MSRRAYVSTIVCSLVMWALIIAVIVACKATLGI